MVDEPTFSLPEAMAAQAALRGMLRLPPERFPLSAMIGMLSDEIEQLRDAGSSDEVIAKVISDSVGRLVDAGDISRFYASSELRQR